MSDNGSDTSQGKSEHAGTGIKSRLLTGPRALKNCIVEGARRLGPRGSAIVLTAIIFIQVGIGTVQGYSGKPNDAPHLLVSGEYRGSAWIFFALAAVLLAFRRRRKSDAVAIVLLSVMPVVRLISYSLSWFLSLDIVGDYLQNTPGLQGSPAAGYGTTSWQSQILLLIMIMWLPSRWEVVTTYLSREEESEKNSGLTSEEWAKFEPNTRPDEGRE